MPSKTGRVGASAPDFVIAEGSEESPTPASDAAPTSRALRTMCFMKLLIHLRAMAALMHVVNTAGRPASAQHV